MPHISFRTSFAAFIAVAVLSACSSPQFHMVSNAPKKTGRDLPALIVTDQPPPEVIYRRGSHDTVFANTDSGVAIGIPSLSSQRVETVVTRKAADLNRELEQLLDNTETSSRQLKALQAKGEVDTSSYYALLGAINKELQTGTTPGNPILVERWNAAQDKLNILSQSTGLMNTLATDLAYQASKGAFLLESTRAAFSLSGAVEEDHRKLQIIEDSVNQGVIAINRLMTRVNDEINRRSVYLRTERANLQALSLAIANGELYGQSLTNSVFKRAVDDGNLMGAGMIPNTPSAASGASASAGPARRPLVIIRFDHPNVEFEQPLYTAVSQALEKYPAAKFDLVAVSAAEGNPARLAMASTEARKNGESVLRSLTQMGLPLERIRLNAANSKDVMNSEVHIYIR